MNIFTDFRIRDLYMRRHYGNYSTPVMLILLIIILGIPASYAQTNFQRHPDPVFPYGALTTWDAEGVGLPAVVKVGETYHMWYMGWNGAEQAIGHATSADGFVWTRDTLNPVLKKGTDGDWDRMDIWGCYVVYDHEIFHLWYTGDSSEVGNAGFQIGHATSPDGSHWTKDTLNPVLQVGPNGGWDDHWVNAGGVLKIDTTFHMWFTAWDGIGNDPRIGHATSVDGSHWSKDPANPVLGHGTSQSWDYPRTDNPWVVYVDNTYHMFFSSGDDAAEQIGYATSSNGSNWTKYAGNPILSYGSQSSWDATNVLFCSVLFDEDSSLYRMWYTGFNNQGNDRGPSIGYAVSDIVSAVDNFRFVSIPEDYALQQNTPNPFNPSTRILFTIPRSENVILEVYNTLGQTVRTLLDKKMPAGSHHVEFDANDLPSGLYFYRIRAGAFHDVKKMMLLK